MTSGKLLQFDTSTNAHSKAEGNLGQVAQSTMHERHSFAETETSVRKEKHKMRQSLERAKFRDTFPSLNVILTVCLINGRSPNAPPYDRRSTEWNEEQEEFARHRAYTRHKDLFKIKGH